MDQASALAQVRNMFAGLTLAAPPNKQMTDAPDDLAVRPGFGKVGEPTKVVANHFKLPDLKEGLTLFMYDVDVDRLEEERTPGGAGPSGGGGGGGRRSGPGQVLLGPKPLPPRAKCYAVVHKLSQQQRWPLGTWAYDGQKQLWIVGSFLSNKPSEYQVELEDESARTPGGAAARQVPTRRPPIYQVVIKAAEGGVLHVGKQWLEHRQGRIPYMPRESVQALDVALRQGGVLAPGNRLVGRGVYATADPVRLGFGLVAMRGYVQSINVTQSGLTVTLDPAVAAVGVVEALLDWIAHTLQVAPNTLQGKELTAAQVAQLNAAVKASPLTVELLHRSHGKTRHKIRGFTDTSARKSKFKTKEGKELTVEGYFADAYKMKLAFPNLPCAVSGGRKRPDWIPAECCVIVPEAGRRQLTGEQTTEILRMAAVPPRDRANATLDNLVRKAKLNTDATAKGFGMDLGPNPTMMTVNARILPPPRLQYGKGQFIHPGDKGDWNLMGVPLWKPTRLESFAVVCYVPRHRVDGGPIFTFLEELKQALEEKGIVVALPAYPPVVYKERGMSDERALTEAVQAATQELGKPPQILFVIQERENQSYNEVKRICDCVLGVQSQLLVSNNIKLTAPAGGMGKKLAGVALKVNIKLGGDNASIAGGQAFEWCPVLAKAGPGGTPARVMMMGADVTHATGVPRAPQTEQQAQERLKRPDQPSIAAVVASTNLECTRYAARIMPNNPLQEFIDGMADATFELLKVFLAANKALPDVIVMFRDGVSEGQFRPVLSTEFQGIKAGCARFTNPTTGVAYNPKVVFTTVQKRHQTRLYPGEAKAADESVGGRSGNIRPGVVVDRDICSSQEFDFYLNSHAGLQGTNKPAKYSVLRDEVGFSADSLQLLAHHMCHIFVRCPRSVSYCPPAYYAHHAAFRGRAWLRRMDSTSETASESSGGSGPGWTWDFSQPHAAIRDTMFFI